MKGKITILMVLLNILFFSLSIVVLADEGVEKAPIWFKLLEPLGVVIGIVALWFCYITKFGGVLGKSYKYIMGMIILFIFAFIWRSLIENGLIPETFFAEIIFETLLYIGIILIAIASRVAFKGFQGLQK